MGESQFTPPPSHSAKPLRDSWTGLLGCCFVRQCSGRAEGTAGRTGDMASSQPGWAVRSGVSQRLEDPPRQALLSPPSRRNTSSLLHSITPVSLLQHLPHLSVAQPVLHHSAATSLQPSFFPSPLSPLTCLTPLHLSMATPSSEVLADVQSTIEQLWNKAIHHQGSAHPLSPTPPYPNLPSLTPLPLCLLVVRCGAVDVPVE